MAMAIPLPSGRFKNSQRLQYVAQYPDGTNIRTLKTKTHFLGRPFQFSVNEVFRMKAEHFGFNFFAFDRFTLQNLAVFKPTFYNFYPSHLR